MTYVANTIDKKIKTRFKLQMQTYSLFFKRIGILIVSSFFKMI